MAWYQVRSPAVTVTVPQQLTKETDLWRKDQHQIEVEEEWKHCEREAAARAGEDEMQRQREQSKVGEKRKLNFVDPDDMVEEKVELSFANVAVAPPQKEEEVVVMIELPLSTA